MDNLPARIPDRPRRRRFAISLRALMISTLVIGLILGLRARRASIQRRAVAEIQRVGGIVQYDYEYLNGMPLSPLGGRAYPVWVRELIGDEYFKEPTAVYLAGSPNSDGERPTDAAIAAVAMLDQVESLQTSGVAISDAGFARLSGMRRLTSLSLADVNVTDEGLAALGSFPSLDTLSLQFRSGAITSRGMKSIGLQERLRSLLLANASLPEPSAFAPLAWLTGLEDIQIPESPSSDVCLEHLRGLNAMRVLCLGRTRLTDAGVGRLSAMHGLENLDFDGSMLSEVGFGRIAKEHPRLKEIHLGPAPNLGDPCLEIASRLLGLEYLYLEWSNVTDAGLDRLRGSKLKGLSVSGASVTDAGVARLAATTPFTKLGLISTGVDGSGFGWLAGQTSLQILWLDRSRVGDGSMAAVATAPSLRALSLRETRLTDAGLAILRAAPRLNYLDVRGTSVTESGLAEFRKARPDVVLSSGPIEGHP